MSVTQEIPSAGTAVARCKLSYLLAPAEAAVTAADDASLATAAAKVRSCGSPGKTEECDSALLPESPPSTKSTGAGASTETTPEKLDGRLKEARPASADAERACRELQEAQARLADADRVAEVLREAVTDLRKRLAEHTEDVPPHPFEHEQSSASMRLAQRQRTLADAETPHILGIAKKLCGSCGKTDGVTNRVFVENGKLYCEYCWTSWERSGWWKPSIRVSTVPPPLSEATGLPHYVGEDAFCLPACLCAHDDLNLFERLKGELPEGREFGDWHGSRHQGIQFQGEGSRHDSASSPPALRATVARLEALFGIRASASRLNLYRSRDDYKPLHADRGRDEQGNPQVTVGASFGGSRELTFMHYSSGVTATFPQRNGDVFAFTPELNKVFLHGVPKIGFGSPTTLEPDAPRLSLILWGSRIKTQD